MILRRLILSVVLLLTASILVTGVVGFDDDAHQDLLHPATTTQPSVVSPTSSPTPARRTTTASPTPPTLTRSPATPRPSTTPQRAHHTSRKAVEDAGSVEGRLFDLRRWTQPLHASRPADPAQHRFHRHLLPARHQHPRTGKAPRRDPRAGQQHRQPLLRPSRPHPADRFPAAPTDRPRSPVCVLSTPVWRHRHHRPRRDPPRRRQARCCGPSTPATGPNPVSRSCNASAAASRSVPEASS